MNTLNNNYQDLFLKNWTNSQIQFFKKNLYMVSSGSFIISKLLYKDHNIFNYFNISCEGSLKKRFYCGLDHVDELEKETEDRAKYLFNMNFACVQSPSGTNANLSVYDAILQDGDTVLCPHLLCGGHLSHFSTASVSCNIKKNINIIKYHRDNDLSFNYNEIERLSLLHKPKLIICGYSSYTYSFSFKKFKSIANKVNAILLADISHIAGLTVAGMHEEASCSDIITTTTYKTLLGPKGAIILWNDEKFTSKIRHAVFPRNNGTQNLSLLFDKCLALQFALTDKFKYLMKQIVLNNYAMFNVFKNANVPGLYVFGGENHHLILCLDSINRHNMLCDTLEKFGIICNKETFSSKCFTKLNCIDNAVRIGTTFTTLCGLDENDHFNIANIIVAILKYDSICDYKEILDNICMKGFNTINNIILEG